MTISRATAERKRRKEELEAERRKIEAEVNFQVQDLGSLSAEIGAEIERLAEE